MFFVKSDAQEKVDHKLYIINQVVIIAHQPTITHNF